MGPVPGFPGEESDRLGLPLGWTQDEGASPVIPLPLKAKIWNLFVRVLRLLLGRNLHALVARTDQGDFAVDPEDFFVGRPLLRSGAYARHELAQLEPLVGPESEVLVVGAHVGTLAIPLARRVRRLRAFEPNPRTFELLRTNVALNGLENVELYQLAASEREETLEFLLSRLNSGGSKRTPKIEDPRYTYDGPERVEVRAAALDEFLEPGDLDLVVMDIEGSEVFALRGMQAHLARTQALQIEFRPHHIRDVAGVGIEAFLEPLLPHFESLRLPTQDREVSGREAMAGALREMFEGDVVDEALLFSKEREDGAGPLS